MFQCALGLGFLTKGPVILLLTGVTLVPYLAFGGRLRSGLKRLASGWGVAIFAALAASWPLAVLWHDPAAARVWALEMSEKTGFSQILEHRRRVVLAGDWPAMVLPWTLVALVAVFLPFVASGRERKRARGEACAGDLPARRSESVWFSWWWCVGNLALFCGWSVAKPNYYLPCLPGMALLIGAAWLELAKLARRQESHGAAAAAAGGSCKPNGSCSSSRRRWCLLWCGI